MQNNGENGKQLIDVGLRIQRFTGLGAVQFQETSSNVDHLVRFDSYILMLLPKKNMFLPIFFV